MLFQNKINLIYCASSWFYYRNILRCTVLQTSNLHYDSFVVSKKEMVEAAHDPLCNAFCRRQHVVFKESQYTSTKRILFSIFIGSEKRILAQSCLSVRPFVFPSPCGITRLPPNGFSCNLIFEYVSKICRETSCKSDQKMCTVHKGLCALISS